MVPKTLLRSAYRLSATRGIQQPSYITSRFLASKTKPLRASEATKLINNYIPDHYAPIDTPVDDVTLPKPFDAKAEGFSGTPVGLASETPIAGEAVVNTADGSFVGRSHFKDFDLAGGVYIVTGGARGLGLAMAEALCEAGGKVYCLDRLPAPDEAFHAAQERMDAHEPSGSLHYAQLDVKDTHSLDSTISFIADQHGRLDGLIAAAGIQQLCPAVDYTPKDARDMLDVNFTGVMMTATAAGRAMMKHKTRGSIVLIASMSGIIANKGLISPVYNASKAAVTQLARNLAMEWGRVQEDGVGGIRVNCISPGHIITPMVQKNFEEVPGLKEKWEKENMLGRLSQPEEFRGAGVFLLSKASSFMTGNNLIIDGGHTAW